MKQILIIFASIMLICSTIIAEQQIDYKGISLSFPDDWIAFTAESKYQALDTIKNLTTMYNDNEFERFSIFAFNPDKDGFFAKIGVGIAKGILLLDDHDNDEYETMLREMLEERDFILSYFDSRVIKIKDKKALLLELEFYQISDSVLTRQYQVSIPGYSNTFKIICTALSESFDEFIPIFNNVISTAKITEKPRVYTHKQPKWLRTLIPIFVILLLLYSIRFVYRKIFKRKSIE